MPPADAPGGLAELEREIRALGAEFADAAGRAIEACLHRAMERLVADRSGWFEGLDDQTAGSFRRAVDEAIRAGAANVAASLRDPDISLSPMTLLEREDPSPMAGLDVPEWFARLALRIAGGSPRDSISELDDPPNRIWVHILNAADPLDPFLREIGLSPSAVPDPGGGHFGLQPRSVTELDPEGTLRLFWDRYKRLYMTYVALRLDRPKAEPGRSAVHRWRGMRGRREV